MTTGVRSDKDVHMRSGHVVLVILFFSPVLAGFQPQQVPPSGSNGRYVPVAPKPYQRACGTVATDVCKVPVTIPPGATGEQVYQMAAQAEQQGHRGEALSYLEKSAEMGYVRAQAAIGIDYANGRGEPRDAQKAVYWLSLAAKQGSRGAQDKLGAIYENGDGVEKDQAKALQFYELAAAQHDSDAEFALGIDYEFGRGVAHNRAKAIEYLRQSSVDGKDGDGTELANVLAGAPAATQFHNFEEISAYLQPKTAARSGGACGGVPTFTGTSNRWGVNFMLLYCKDHPGCPWRNNDPTGAMTMHCGN